MIQKTKSILIISILAVLVIGFTFFTFQQARTGTEVNVYGWAWSSTTGWISFNSWNCNPDDQYPTGATGTTENTEFLYCPNGSTTAKYGVNIDTGTGKLSGYAWSENIGWIAFDPSTASHPNQWGTDASCTEKIKSDCAAGQAILGSDKQITGWARALAPLEDVWGEGGGWDGWIHFNDTIVTHTPPYYQVTIDTGVDPAEFKNFAWGGDMVMGWISFNQENCAVNPTPPGCPIGGAPFDYKVWTTLNLSAPKVVASSTATDTSEIYCGVTDYVPITFNWDYSDTNGYKQSAYVVEVYDTLNNLVVRSCDNTISPSNPNGDPNAKCTVDSRSFALKATDNHLGWGQTYNWRIMVWNDQDASSTWSIGPSFTTIAHAYPEAGFTWLPVHPVTSETVYFCPATTTEGICTEQNLKDAYGYLPTLTRLFELYPENQTWEWTFVNGDPANSTFANPTTTFSTPGQYNVTMWVTEHGFENGNPHNYGPCPFSGLTKMMSVTKPAPKIKEVPPL